MKVSEGNRLLTEVEKKVILDGYNNMKKSNLIIILAVAFLIYIIASIMWGAVWWIIYGNAETGIRQGLICFMVISIFTGVWVIQHFVKLKVIVKKVQDNTLYVKEAIYEKTSGKYNTVYLQMYNKGKMTYDGYSLLVREQLQRGDKVIVLQMKGRKWVYKARD